MDRLTRTSCWGLVMLSLASVAVVAYRNDLSSNRHGCIWSTIDQTREASTGSNSNSGVGSNSANYGGIPNPTTGLILPPTGSIGVGSGGGSLNCNLRTLSVDFWNYTFNREQIELTRIVKIKCSDKLFFESSLSPNQTLFQLRNLKEVQIESCKIRRLPRRVWASLTKLKTLVIRTQNTEWRSSSSVGLEIESGAFEGLGALEVLDLSQNNIWAFPDKHNVLCPLRSLSRLNVSHNRLSDLDELSWTSGSSSGGSGNVPTHDDGSSSINRDNYCALSVQNLDLSHNSLRRVGRDAFSKMKRLTELRLQNNLIGELEDTAFGGLTQLKLVNLSSNRLVALPPSIFKANLNLRELYLQNNSISALSSQVLSKMDQLLLLDLSSNTLSSQWIKEDMFKGLIRLVVLKISSNQLSYIDSIVFRDLISLQALHLDNNRIETINPESFHSLSNLHILDLSNNRLTYVDSSVFSRLFVLRQLYLDHNKIRKMDDDSLKNCSSLQDLGLADNAFTEVPVALQSAGLGLLTTLDIGENKISQVSNSSFAGMTQLYGLRMVDSRLTEIPSGFCESLKKLRVLNLSQNRIKTVSSSAFTSCPELRVLRLDTNSLEELPSSLAPQLPSLLWLNVSENRLTWADYHSLPPTIEWLDLSYNSIQSLTGPLSLSSSSLLSSDEKLKQINANGKRSPGGVPPFHLRVLDVSYNKLKHLDQFALPSSLETLRANHNELKSVAPDTFIRISRIRRVELIGNQIENLPLASLRLQAIPSGRTLPEFYLGDNPFLCDCSMEWLTRVTQLAILRTHPRIVDLDAIVCRTTFSRSGRSPSTLLVGSSSSSSSQNNSSNNIGNSIGIGSQTTSLIPLVEARPRDFLCPYKSHCFALCHCCEFEFCDCEMTCPDNCTCHHDTAWSSNIVECSNAQYETIPSRIPMDATEIYLDGNQLFQLGSHIFIGKKNLRTLFLNDSHVELIKNKTFNGLKSLEVLRLEENLLTELHGYEFADLESLRELYLHNNLLRFIALDTFINLKFLQVLRLDGNLLVDFNVWELSRNGYLNSVMLAGNPWSCECEFLIPYRNWVVSKTAIVVDFTLAKCQMFTHEGNEDGDDDSRDATQTTISSMCNSSPLLTSFSSSNADALDANHNHEMEINNHISAMGGEDGKILTNPPGPHSPPPSENHLNFSRLETSSADNTFWVLVLCLSGLLIVILVVLLIFRDEIYYWTSTTLFQGPMSCCCCPRPPKAPGGGGLSSLQSGNEDDFEKLFDAYFLYGRSDEDLLSQKIAPELELGMGKKFRLCLHYRDLCLSPEGPWNREMVLSACDASKRVVVLLSRNFLQFEWNSSSSFRTAVQSTISLHPNKLIFILLPPLTEQNLSEISPELNRTLRNSCLEWNDKHFWVKFHALLPSPSMNRDGTLSELSGATLPYNIVMNPNLHQHHPSLTNTLSGQHYHQQGHGGGIVLPPYQIPMMTRNNSLPPIPKHQIVLPAPPTMNNHWQQQHQDHQLHLNNHQRQPQFGSMGHHHTHHPTSINGIISPNNHSLIHPIPSQLTPQHFPGYSNDDETFHPNQLQSNHHHHHQNHPGHHLAPSNNQPIHFSSQQNHHHNLHHLQQPTLLSSPSNVPSSFIPPHSHSSSQISKNSSNIPFSNPSIMRMMGYNNKPGLDEGVSPEEANYSSSAVSSCANDEFDHVYSTLDSPIQSPAGFPETRDDATDAGFCSPNNDLGCRGGVAESNGLCGHHNHLNNGSINCSPKVNQHHQTQHSTSSGISSGSDATTSSSGEMSSNAVSPSSPIKNGILNKLNQQRDNNSNSCSGLGGGNNNTSSAPPNGKMYFV
jgi:Leucine-rich repeat (LRR) protein